VPHNVQVCGERSRVRFAQGKIDSAAERSLFVWNRCESSPDKMSRQRCNPSRGRWPREVVGAGELDFNCRVRVPIADENNG